MKSQRTKFQRIALPLLAFFAMLACWQGAIVLFDMSPLILPGPGVVGVTLASQLPNLVHHAAVTLLEATLGFLLGSGLAALLAVVFNFSRNSERALYPYAIATKAIPLVALAPIVVAWFGGGLISKVVLASIISFFPVLVNVVDGLRSVEPDALELMKSLSASRWQTFTKLQFPAALPQVFAGLKVASSFSVVGAVVAEFVNSQAGIGYVIKSSSYYLDTNITFAAILVAAAIGLAFFGTVSWLQTVLVFWKKNAQDTLTRASPD